MRFVDVTETAAQRSGYTREELLQMGPEDFSDTPRADLERYFDAAIAAGAKGTRFEHLSRLKDGTKIYVEIRRRALRLGGRWIIFSSTRDISKRKRAELAALRLGRMFAALSATNEVIMRTPTTEELYASVCNAAVDGGKFLGASICCTQENSARMRVVAASGPEADRLKGLYISMDQSTPEGSGLVGTAFHSQTPCVSDDFFE